MTIYAYARCSSASQTLDSQLDQLIDAGVPKKLVRTDMAVSGTTKGASRPGLSTLLGELQPGDQLFVVRFDRLGRDAADVLAVVDALHSKGVVVRSLTEGVDSSTKEGRLVLGILSNLAQYERAQMREKQASGIKSAKARGKRLGRPSKLTDAQRAHARKLSAAGASHNEVATLLGVSLSTARRAVAQ